MMVQARAAGLCVLQQTVEIQKLMGFPCIPSRKTQYFDVGGQILYKSKEKTGMVQLSFLPSAPFISHQHDSHLGIDLRLSKWVGHQRMSNSIMMPSLLSTV